MGGGKLNKAFTLIELLAIIVILAIIAVITIPIILNVVDNAKRGSVIDSAYGYKDAIHKFYVQKLYEDQSFKLDGTYMVSNLKVMGLTVEGNEPTDDSWVVINNNEVYDFSLKFDDYVANYDVPNQKIDVIKNGTIELTPEAQAEQDRIDNVKRIVRAYIEESKTKNSSLTSETVKSVSEMTDVVIENGPVDGWVHFIVTDGEVVIKNYSLKVDNYIADYSSTETDNMVITKDGTLRNRPIVRTIVSTIDGVGYYNTEWIGANPVYYNPVTGASCTDYSVSNSNNGVKTGCLKWYAYSENADGTVNMLLDHNTTFPETWITSDDYEAGNGIPSSALTLGITYSGGSIVGEDSTRIWNKGPITLLRQLKTDTDGWSEKLVRTDSYTNRNNHYDSSNLNKEIYTINYTGYKAKIITAQEVAYIVGFDSWDERSTSSSYFHFDSHSVNESATCKFRGDISGCSYRWLYDRTSTSCTDYGCLNNSDSGYGGYWTVSSYAPTNYLVWRVYEGGSLGNNILGYDNSGLRPVITVSKSDIFES
ncbi:MAG: hypothetical protein J6D28_01670 [Bacilli bacterium]|nr:hypothetical protein [Bacilli bacterium]